jgi:hypothetical protein
LKNQQIGILVPKFVIPKKKLRRNAVHIIFTRKQLQYLFLPKLHHAAILTSTQNELPPSLHLLKMVAAISTSTQNKLPPSLHLLKTVVAISTFTQKE